MSDPLLSTSAMTTNLGYSWYRGLYLISPFGQSAASECTRQLARGVPSLPEDVAVSFSCYLSTMISSTSSKASSSPWGQRMRVSLSSSNRPQDRIILRTAVFKYVRPRSLHSFGPTKKACPGIRVMISLRNLARCRRTRAYGSRWSRTLPARFHVDHSICTEWE